MRQYDREFLQGMKKALQVDLIGVASVDNSPELKEKASVFLPTAKSVVVFAKETYKAVVALLAPSKEAGAAEPGEVLGAHASYIYGRLNKAVHDVANIFSEEGYRSIPLCATPNFITDQRFVKALFCYKHAAVLAGLGTLGRNSLLITPGFGPRVRLACLLTEAPLEETPSVQEDLCVGCNACVRDCPAEAIQAPEQGRPYKINRFACRAYRQAGLVCSVCLKVCDQATGGSSASVSAGSGN
jgi:epoxyqueuosine reductase QueG